MLFPTTRERRPKGERAIQGKPRWSANLVMAAAVVIVIGMQLSLPSSVAAHPQWLLPTLEALLLVGLVGKPRKIDPESPLLRTAILALTATIILANAWWAIRVMGDMILGGHSLPASVLLTAGAAIWLINVIVFALWYWELERGRPYADFLFVQMQSPELAPPGWEPTFTDYLYLSFTNATAFSPTDVLPLSRWAKLTMMFQSAVSLSTVVLVITRAVDTLN